MESEKSNSINSIIESKKHSRYLIENEKWEIQVYAFRFEQSKSIIESNKQSINVIKDEKWELTKQRMKSEKSMPMLLDLSSLF